MTPPGESAAILDISRMERERPYPGDAMVIATDSVAAPWTVVNSNDKRRARLEAIRHVLHAFACDHRDDEVVHAPDPQVVQPAAARFTMRAGR